MALPAAFLCRPVDFFSLPLWCWCCLYIDSATVVWTVTDPLRQVHLSTVCCPSPSPEFLAQHRVTALQTPADLKGPPVDGRNQHLVEGQSTRTSELGAGRALATRPGGQNALLPICENLQNISSPMYTVTFWQPSRAARGAGAWVSIFGSTESTP
jgi:hypothetical protein